ncbi:hypothetical protein [Deinococcus sp. 23YEL01]|uniref:hypothetical protein n=1 Tax=Deinococcus sp. 23YEL01 TaxID=2745871 RepID=UPI001E4C5448|nr:hypothetical protein [Deinococcus sp. 23YEL01]MCD0168032.1 hypothetical protein [Deinococcus sp. 23YEL01]
MNAESASEAAPAPLPDPTNDDHLEDWTEEDDRLFNLTSSVDEQGTPDGVSPTGEGLPTLTPSLDHAQGMQEPEPVTDLEQVPPAARTAAEPGSPVYERLVALCGGGLKNPNLLNLLGELTRGGNPRTLWLTLSLAQVEQARESAQARREEVPFRTGLLEALDAAADGDAPIPAPRAARLTFRDHEQTPRPGDGNTAPKPNPWQVRQRIRLDGDRLGIVVSTSADARQASVTVDLDDGTRVGLLSTEFKRLTNAPDAPPAITEHPLMGTTWRLASTGAIVTVETVRAGRPTTSDGTTWPPFGAASLARMATQIEQGDAGHGAA